jgi:hypothetical protein
MSPEITRDAVVAQLAEYWALLPQLSAAKPETLVAAQAYLADDYVMRCGDLPVEFPGDEMLQGIATENDEKWVTHVEPYYVIVDPVQARAAAHFYEKLVDPDSGQILRESSYFSHVQFAMESGRLKMRHEHIVEVPAKFKVDVRPGEPGAPEK